MARDRTTYVYDESNGWSIANLLELSVDRNASATILSDGSITLRDSKGVTLFSGKMEVAPATDTTEASPIITLTAADGSKGVYPYSLLGNGSLSIVAHDKASGPLTRQTFIRYSFSLTPAVLP